ncbi:MAG: polymer-forming cytoskeletal protein [Elusimicrobia bacterium]|nr:polymer-forming cytoskeletal protein [Elusimicrobiota bacterium]
MFNRKDSSALSDKIATLIGSETYFQGTLSAKGSLRVDGRVEGNLQDCQVVVVGKSGTVTGDIAAQEVIIGGQVLGNITATKQLEILCGGKVQGDIRTARLTIEEGSLFNGSCAMNAHDNSKTPDAPVKPEPEEESNGE